jgi:hypothetical protein
MSPTCCVLDIPASEARTDCPMDCDECRYDGWDAAPQRRPMPARQRHRHSRAEVRAQQHRDTGAAKPDPACTCYVCYRRGGVSQAWWRKRNDEPRPLVRKERDRDRADFEEAAT